MPEQIENAAENILNNIVDSISETLHKQKSGKFSEEQSKVSDQVNKLFGRQNSVHSLFGGGKCEQNSYARFHLYDGILTIFSL